MERGLHQFGFRWHQVFNNIYNCPHHGSVRVETILLAAIEVLFLCHTLPLTPGQASGLQTLVSMFPPIEEQSEPPLRGTGLVQFLVLT